MAKGLTEDKINNISKGTKEYCCNTVSLCPAVMYSLRFFYPGSSGVRREDGRPAAVYVCGNGLTSIFRIPTTTQVAVYPILHGIQAQITSLGRARSSRPSPIGTAAKPIP